MSTSPFFDYEHTLRTDLKYKQKLIDLCNKLVTLTEKSKRSVKHKKELDQTLRQLLEHTQFNMSPLLPYYFPKYPKQKPFSLKNFPYAYALFNITLGRDAFFCVKGSRQIIKSTCLAIRDTLATQLFPGLRSMLITPRAEQLKTLADKYKEVGSAYRFPSNHKKFRDNLFYKEFPNGSVLKMIYILTNADKVRGNSFDWLNYDEYQDFDNSLELEVMEIMTQSDWPMITKTGTSKTIDSALESTYLQSSRSLWRMTCTACRHDNYPTLEHDVLDMIKPKGVCCKKCGHALDVRKGCWDHESPDALQAGRIGLHVPKIIVPENTERPDKWYPIYQQSLSKDKKKFLEEVLGIATQEGAREITVKELEAICTLGPRSKVLKNAKAGHYKYIISGCDWGGSDYIPAHNLKESYTVHAVIGVTNNWDFDIIHLDQFSGMNYDQIASIICQTHEKLGGYAIASDFGVGAVYNMKLRERIDPHRHVIFNYAGPGAAFVAEPKSAHLFNQLALNKTESITSLFDMIKQKRIRCYNWTEAGDRLTELTHLIRNPSDTGVITYRRHGSKPDDTLHAINFAINMAKIVIGEKLFEDDAVADDVIERISAGTSSAVGIGKGGGGVVIG